MELILLESVEGLGRPGDQVKVRAGYARNFLLPKGKAVPITAEAVRSLDKLKAKAEAEERAMISSMEELSGKIQGARVEIAARATEEGHLFGSVTERDIHGALIGAGWDLPLRAVRLPAHLKEAGEHEVELHLYGEITTTVTVLVIPVDVHGNTIELASEEEGEEQAAAAEGEGEAREPTTGEAPTDAPSAGA
jgi:large subunit ribosomal protein L9